MTLVNRRPSAICPGRTGRLVLPESSRLIEPQEDALAAEHHARSVRQRQLLNCIFRHEVVPPTETQLMAVAMIDYRITVLHERRKIGNFNPTETLNDITDNMMFLAISRASCTYPNTIEAFDQDPELIAIPYKNKSCSVWRLIYCLLASDEAQTEFVRLCSIVCDLLQRCLYEIQLRTYKNNISDMIRVSSNIH